jgi:hypothetical protein
MARVHKLGKTYTSVNSLDMARRGLRATVVTDSQKQLGYATTTGVLGVQDFSLFREYPLDRRATRAIVRTLDRMRRSLASK